VDFSWTEKASEMLGHGNMHGEVISRGGIIRSRFWGPCPRCKHDVDDRQIRNAAVGLMGAQARCARGGCLLLRTTVST
jgi:hypothetical protein